MTRELYASDDWTTEAINRAGEVFIDVVTAIDGQRRIGLGEPMGVVLTTDQWSAIRKGEIASRVQRGQTLMTEGHGPP